MLPVQPKPFWNVAALSLPFVAGVGGCIAGAEPESLKPLVYMMVAGGAGSVLGVAAAIVALVRREKRQQLSILALSINVVIVLLLLGKMI